MAIYWLLHRATALSASEIYWPLRDEIPVRLFIMNRQAIIQEREHIRKTHMEQVAKDRVFRKMLRAIKDKLDLFGEEALNEVEMGYVEERPGFFYPRREE